jgi:HEAT repeat protein
MAIRTSSARDVDALLAQLDGSTSSEREAAVARLRVIGTRAHTRVLALAADPTASSAVRVAALRVVDGVADPRVRRVATEAANDPDPAVATAAVQALRAWLQDETEPLTLETISGIIVDPERPRAVRRAALDALSDLPPDITRPLVERVTAELSSEPTLDTAVHALDWLISHADAPLGVVHDVLTHARDRERDAGDAVDRASWLAVRVFAHRRLAERGSRLALHDLRESFERAQAALPLDLLTALRTLGDLSCLDAIATAWDRVADAWWRDQLVDTARAIVAREKATGRHAVIRRIRARCPALLPTSPKG